MIGNFTLKRLRHKRKRYLRFRGTNGVILRLIRPQHTLRRLHHH